MTDTLAYRLATIILGLAVLATITGGIVLAFQDPICVALEGTACLAYEKRTLPDSIIAIGGGGGGALAMMIGRGGSGPNGGGQVVLPSSGHVAVSVGRRDDEGAGGRQG